MEPMQDAPLPSPATPLNSETQDSTTETLPTLTGVTESTESEAEMDPGDIVEQAEQLLREGAPHDYEVLVIGGGRAGCAAALRAAELGARVGLVEAASLGGPGLRQDALFRTLHRLARLREETAAAKQSGLLSGDSGQLEWVNIRAAASALAAAERETLERTLDEHHVARIEGYARFTGEHTVEVTGNGPTLQLAAVHLIVACGASEHPTAIALPDQAAGLMGSLEQLSQRGTLPGSCLLVKGSSYDATESLEWASVLASLGIQVALIDEATKPLPFAGISDDLRNEIVAGLDQGGSTVLFGCRIERAELNGSRLKVHLSHGTTKQKSQLSSVDVEALLDMRREPALEGLQLDKAGVQIEDGSIKIDEGYNTSVSGVYAVGDCVTAGECINRVSLHGIRAAESALERPFSRESNAVPYLCRIQPALAVVGDVDATQVVRQRGQARYMSKDGTKFGDSRVELVSEGPEGRVIGCIMVGEEAVKLANAAEMAIHLQTTCTALAQLSSVPLASSPKNGLTDAARDALRNTA